MVEILIDGKVIRAGKNDTILKAARRGGIDIPTFCYHDSLPAVGACRLCIVELLSSDGRETGKYHAACEIRVSDGMRVRTTSPMIRKIRCTTVALLLAKAPSSAPLQRLALRLGAELPPGSDRDKKNDCVLCLKCTRACESMRIEAIGQMGRGCEKAVSPPFDEPPNECIGCGACAAICPVDCIDMQDTRTHRTIWGRRFSFEACQACGVPVMTREHKAYALENTPLGEAYFCLCPECKRKQLFNRVKRIGK